MIRVTQRSIADRTMAGLQMNLSKLGDIQQQLSSGKQISKPSDDPTGTVKAMQYRSQISTAQQWSRNASDGVGWLSTTDSTLTGMLTSLQRVRDLVVQGANTGSNGQDAREAIATEVDQLKQSLLGDANTTYLGRPIFGGITAGPQAYDASGTYQGKGPGVYRTAGDSPGVRVDVTGPEVFGSGTTGVFGVVQSISDHLRYDPTQLQADLSNLDAAMKTVTAQLGDVGARTNRLDAMKQAADDQVTALQGEQANVESIDLPKTIVDLQLQQTAYQAALGATSRIVSPTLLDFLK